MWLFLAHTVSNNICRILVAKHFLQALALDGTLRPKLGAEVLLLPGNNTQQHALTRACVYPKGHLPIPGEKLTKDMLHSPAFRNCICYVAHFGPHEDSATVAKVCSRSNPTQLHWAQPPFGSAASLANSPSDNLRRSSTIRRLGHDSAHSRGAGCSRRSCSEASRLRAASRGFPSCCSLSLSFLGGWLVGIIGLV